MSLEKAARLAGLSVEAFIEQLGVMGLPAVDCPPDEISQEVELLRS